MSHSSVCTNRKRASAGGGCKTQRETCHLFAVAVDYECDERWAPSAAPALLDGGGLTGVRVVIPCLDARFGILDERQSVL